MLWHSIIHGNKIPSDCAVILIPSSTDELSPLYSVKYLKAFLQYNEQFKTVFFLTDYLKLNNLVTEFQAEEKVEGIILLNEREITQLISFYDMDPNDVRFIIASLDIPCGRNARDYIKIHILSEEEIFLIGLYNVQRGPEYEKFIRSYPA